MRSNTDQSLAPMLTLVFGQSGLGTNERLAKLNCLLVSVAELCGTSEPYGVGDRDLVGVRDR